MMLSTIEHIIELARKADAGTATTAELEQLVAWTASEQASVEITKLTTLNLEWLGDRYPARLDDPRSWDDAIANILVADRPERLPDMKVKKIKVLQFKRYWVAASIILLLGLGFLFYQRMQRQASSPTTANQTPKDIPAPVTNRAMITLADGSKVYLDSTGNGQLAQQGNVKLVKLANGQIAYQTADGQTLKEPQYNTLTNPRGSKVIDMMLSDGSHVWLNAGSSITYPVAFISNERKVELKGEGYFEVAKDRSKKFIVQAGGLTTEVLGTHFNINSYSNEPDTRVTLLEGAVCLRHNSKSIVLKPGQQGIAGNEPLTINYKPDMNQVMAWKNGYFSFDGLTLKQAMTQLERWYDIDVTYEGDVENIELVGEMTRGITLKGLMEVLKKIGVHYQLEGRKLIIKQ